MDSDSPPALRQVLNLEHPTSPLRRWQLVFVMWALYYYSCAKDSMVTRSGRDIGLLDKYSIVHSIMTVVKI